MAAKYFPGLFQSRYPCLNGRDWLRRIDTEDLQVFVDIGARAHNHGRDGGLAILNKKGREYLQHIGRIGAISANSKKLWNRLMQDEIEKLGI